jgi:Tfp pilus assembly major pilin PilA
MRKESMARKKSFTIIELIATIVITAILGTIALDILRKVYRHYVVTRELTKLNIKTEAILNLISSNLQHRLKNSLIAISCNVSTGDCDRANIDDFLPVNQIPDNNDSYRVLEWLQIDRYGRIGEWNGTLLKPGWSGFVDLKNGDTTQLSDGNWSIATPYSDPTIIQDILGDYFKQWGISGNNDVFGNGLAVLVFGGPAGRGTISADYNNSYGYYHYPAEQLYFVEPQTNTKWKIYQVSVNQDEVKIFQDYYILRGGGAIVPVPIGNGEFNLTYRFNYFPWLDQNYTDGNSTIIGDHITFFKFREKNGNLRLYICITTDNIDLKEYNLTVCKEKVVF